jgi:hypothetical protein
MTKLSFVSLALVALGLGCFRSRGMESDTDAGRCFLPSGMVCCSSAGPVDSPGGPCPFQCPVGTSMVRGFECAFGDGGVPSDGGFPIDAGPACEPRRADWTCLVESFLAPANEPFELPVTFDTCGCCPSTTCGVEVDRGAQVLRLSSGLCNDDVCDCAGCNAPTARCAVPPLPRGDWTVEVNGAPAFVLPVEEEISLVPPPPACVRYAAPDVSCEPSDPLDAQPEPTSEVCIAQVPTSSRLVARLVNDCGGCASEGTCTAVVTERFTDDLPPGGEIRLSPTRYFSACGGACPPVCIETERECPLPTLIPGGFYRVYVHDELVLSFTEGDLGEDPSVGACGTTAP